MIFEEEWKFFKTTFNIYKFNKNVRELILKSEKIEKEIIELVHNDTNKKEKIENLLEKDLNILNMLLEMYEKFFIINDITDFILEKLLVKKIILTLNLIKDLVTRSNLNSTNIFLNEELLNELSKFENQIFYVALRTFIKDKNNKKMLFETLKNNSLFLKLNKKELLNDEGKIYE